jgi:hypothetical protein
MLQHELEQSEAGKLELTIEKNQIEKVQMVNHEVNLEKVFKMLVVQMKVHEKM